MARGIGQTLVSVNTGCIFPAGETLLAETRDGSAVLDPKDGEWRLYRRSDWLQQHDLADRYPGEAQRLLERAEGTRRLHDDLLRQDRVWPASPS